MATTRKPTRADDYDYALGRDEGLGTARPTDCAACHAPLPPEIRYLCAACVAESARRAETLLASLGRGAPGRPAASRADSPEGDEVDELMVCPTCGMGLDDSGRCAGCVTTVRR